ncbi:MAG: ABC transporter ATP-binding protein [Xanthobacteraceae bacterium]|nr:MAG: ABC transporter ATP-binding protein [Xanthobacteraceae bacterium]
MTPLLHYDAVEACYGHAQILHGTSFSVDKGASVAILGRNGVGKTTVVNTLFGIARLTGGTIRLAGKPLTRPRPYSAARAGVSVVIQGRGILQNLTVRENLLLGAATRRRGPWNLQRVYELYPVLQERADAPGTALSGGQQQMLALGRGLMANPDLLVLDEPSEGLAPVIVDELAVVLNRLRAEGTTILLIEQNLSLVERVAEDFFVLSKGRIVDQGKIAATGRAELQKHIAI